MKLTINHSYDGYWISSGKSKGISYYLWHDGTLNPCCLGSERYVNDGWYRTKEEAQKMLDSWLPQTEWITKEQVVQAANLSDEAAFKCSLNHWKQIVLNFDTFESAKTKNLVNIDTSFCALCQRNKFTKHCPLKVTCNAGQCIPEYGDFARFGIYTLENAIKMVNRLQTTYNKLYGGKIDTERLEQVRKDIKLLKDEENRIQEELKKVELKHGDLVISLGCGGTKRVVIKINGKLKIFDTEGYEYIQSDNFKDYVRKYGYQKVGNIWS